LNTLEEKLLVDTPEAVGIEFEIAGVGSRIVAGLVDGFIMVLLLTVLVLAPMIGLASGIFERVSHNLKGGSKSLLSGVDAVAVALIMLVSFVIIWFYYVAAELLTDGRSPGKRSAGLRVVRTDGFPIGLSESVVRNLVRAVDVVPGVYLVGLVTMLISPRTQRLGDLAAGTIVVRERVREKSGRMPALSDAMAGASDVRVAQGLGPAETHLLLRYRERAPGLEPLARTALAGQIAVILRGRLNVAADPRISDEEWLETFARDRGPWAGPS
jgi:uncharacterized RDD family membrane protein YckC